MQGSTFAKPFAHLLSRALIALVAVLLTTLVSAAEPPEVYGEISVEGFENLEKSTYDLAQFSDRYKATLEIANQDDVFRPGIVSVLDKKTGATLIQVKSDELVLDTDAKTGEVATNVHELPYGEQSVLIHEDFNFDGIKDLAVMDGQNSCYHGPSFQVFLGTADGFEHNDAFTELAQNYCGMFAIDPKSKQVSTMTKDGCCIHEMATYVIQKGEPVMQTQTVVDQTGASGLIEETDSENRNGKMVSTTRTLWSDDDGRQTLLAFKLAPSGKRIVVFTPGGSVGVYYAAVDDKDQVGLVYPQAEGEQFAYDSARHVLSFVRGDTTYRILGDDQGNAKAMQVEVRGKVTDLKLQPGKPEGSLLKVAKALEASAG